MHGIEGPTRKTQKQNTISMEHINSEVYAMLSRPAVRATTAKSPPTNINGEFELGVHGADQNIDLLHSCHLFVLLGRETTAQALQSKWETYAQRASFSYHSTSFNRPWRLLKLLMFV